MVFRTSDQNPNFKVNVTLIGQRLAVEKSFPAHNSVMHQ
jgi:hypothetical protein